MFARMLVLYRITYNSQTAITSKQTSCVNFIVRVTVPELHFGRHGPSLQIRDICVVGAKFEAKSNFKRRKTNLS